MSNIPPTPADTPVVSVLGPLMSGVPITCTVELGVTTTATDVGVGLVAVECWEENKFLVSAWPDFRSLSSARPRVP